MNAETKDHLNWQLLGECAGKLFKGDAALLPPPEEERQVKTAIGASRAEQGRRSD